MSPSDGLQSQRRLAIGPSSIWPMDCQSVQIITMDYHHGWMLCSPNMSQQAASRFLDLLCWIIPVTSCSEHWGTLRFFRNSLFQLFCNIYQVIIFHPHDKLISTVFSGFLVLIFRWGASQNRLGWWAGCTAFRPPAAEIYKWKWKGIACIIPSKKVWLEGTARAVDLKLVDLRWLSIPQTCRNCRRRHRGQYHPLCSTSVGGTPTSCYQISNWSQCGWAWDCKNSRPKTNI